MSAATADPTSAEVSEEQQRDWKDEFKENWLGVRLGLEGLMLDKWQKQTAAALELAKQAREGTIGKPAGDAKAESEDMGVSIGNKTFIQMPAESAAAPQTMVAPAKKGLVSRMLPLALAAAAGAGVPYALTQLPELSKLVMPDAGYTVRVAIQHPDGRIEPVVAEQFDSTKLPEFQQPPTQQP